MRDWLKASLTFLFWLALIQLARLLMVLLCLAEVLLVLVLWPLAFIEAHQHDSWLYLLMPIGMTLLVAIQVALWQFMWLRLAQRGGHWRALAECFSRVVRYPVVREPHSWE